jgi:hypothetical protein
VLITFEVVDYPGQTPRVFGPYTMTEAKTFISTRLRARLVKLKVEHGHGARSGGSVSCVTASKADGRFA